MARIRDQRYILVVVAVIAVIMLTTGCSSSSPALVPTEKPLLDKKTILRQAANDYFVNIPSSYNLIDAPGLKAKMDQPGKIYLIDIRKPEDFAVGHIPGAINIPFTEMGQWFETLPKDKEIVVYCYSGQTSGQAIAILKMNGFDALSLLGGFPEWSKRFPTLK